MGGISAASRGRPRRHTSPAIGRGQSSHNQTAFPPADSRIDYERRQNAADGKEVNEQD